MSYVGSARFDASSVEKVFGAINNEDEHIDVAKRLVAMVHIKLAMAWRTLFWNQNITRESST